MIIPVERAHLQGIADLTLLCGFPERSARGWEWALFDYPEQGDEPAGYVDFRDGKVCAFLGTQKRVLRCNGGTVSMIAGHTMITDLQTPSIGLRLMRHVIKHHQTDAISTLNNNALAAPLFPRVGLMPWLGETAKYSAECRIDWGALVTSSILRMALKHQSREAYDRQREFFTRHNRKHITPDTLNGLTRLNPETHDHAQLIDTFNTAMQSGKQYQANRSSSVWKHRLSDPDFPTSTTLYGSLEDGQLKAMLALSVTKDNKLSPAALEIEDIAILPGAQVELADMLKAAKHLARKFGLARVRMHYMRGITEPGLFHQRGWVLRHKNYACCHAVSSDQTFLENWAVSPIDGDFFFALRREPTSITQREISAPKSSQ